MSGRIASVPGGEIASFHVAEGAVLRVINTHGGQVVDAWFYAADDWDEYASMSHSRAALRTVRPGVGDSFVSRRRVPLITIVADSSPGVHDMTMPPCDAWRYEQLGAPGHRNCADNLRTALAEHGYTGSATIPDPLNLFQNSPIDAEGRITFQESPAPAGASVSLRPHRDVIAFFSACPMDIMPINGGSPREIGVTVVDQAGEI